MRVVSGRLGGRTFEAPKGHRTHPMSDKVRGALYSALGDVEGLTVLDAFAGSGALSIEAISRGAASAVALDIDNSANTTIVNNLKQLGITDQIKVIRANANVWSANNPDARFDLVLLDPPYGELQVAILAKLAEHCKPGGVVVLSLPPRSDFVLDEEFEQLRAKSYGDAQLVYYRKL